MNYITEILAFYDWLESNRLSTSAVALWHALMAINNKCKWEPDFSASIDTLKWRTGCSRDAIYRARNTLRQKGRITFTEKSGNQSARYAIIPFASGLTVGNATQSATQTATQGATQSATQSATQTATHPYIYKQNETKQDSSGGSIARAMYDQSLADLMAYYEDNTGSAAPRSVGQAIFQWRERMPDDLIRAAIDTAAKAGKNWNYAEGCLKRWERDGIRTLAALQAAEEAARQQPQPHRKTAQDEFLAIARGEIP